MLLDESDNTKGIDWYDLKDHGSCVGEESKIDDRSGRSMKKARGA